MNIQLSKSSAISSNEHVASLASNLSMSMRQVEILIASCLDVVSLLPSRSMRCRSYVCATGNCMAENAVWQRGCAGMRRECMRTRKYMENACMEEDAYTWKRLDTCLIGMDAVLQRCIATYTHHLYLRYRMPTRPFGFFASRCEARRTSFAHPPISPICRTPLFPYLTFYCRSARAQRSAGAHRAHHPQRRPSARRAQIWSACSRALARHRRAPCPERSPRHRRPHGSGRLRALALRSRFRRRTPRSG